MFLDLPKKAHDLTGRRFGRLVVIGLVDIIRYPRPPAKQVTSHPVWLCQCDCGNTTKVRAGHLRVTMTQSCGCLRRIVGQELNTTHGHVSKRTSFESSEYRSWRHLISRCRNPNDKRYAHYGGRGITVCHEWVRSFEAFYSSMGPKPTPQHSIDRIDNDGHYEPANCRWATATEQTNNTSRNKRLTIGDVTMTIADWAKSNGIDPRLATERIRKGWDGVDAVQFGPSARPRQRRNKF